MDKERTQIVILAILILGIIGVVIYFNIDRLKPTAIVGVDVGAPRAQLQINVDGANALFERDDYKGLEEFGIVPVRPMGLGNDSPFSSGSIEVEQ